MEQKWANNLNNDELNLIQTTWYPKLKKNATDKIKAQLFELGEELKEIKSNEGFKISLGENYLDLPYLVLDFPKIPGNNFSWVFRTLFWWGNYSAFEVIISKAIIQENEQEFWNLLLDSDWVLVSDQMWSNDIQSGDFKLKKELYGLQLNTLPGAYVKVMRVVPIKKPESLFEGAIGFYKLFLSFLP